MTMKKKKQLLCEDNLRHNEYYGMQNTIDNLYKPRKLLQVVGHTPMDEITREGNLISTDVFSTYRDGKPIGTEEFLLLDTVTWEYCGIKM